MSTPPARFLKLAEDLTKAWIAAQEEMTVEGLPHVKFALNSSLNDIFTLSDAIHRGLIQGDIKPHNISRRMLEVNALSTRTICQQYLAVYASGCDNEYVAYVLDHTGRALRKSIPSLIELLEIAGRPLPKGPSPSS